MLQARLELETGAVFNTCLLNQYRHGKDHMSWHSDNEALYGSQPVIGSVSFGEARDFVLRHNDDHSLKIIFPLGNGDMLTMQVGRAMQARSTCTYQCICLMYTFARLSLYLAEAGP